MKNKKTAVLAGIFAGFLNGLFGSGGGIIAVPLFKKSGLSQKEAQATALFTVAVAPETKLALWLDFIGSITVAAYLIRCGIKTVFEAAKN